MVWKIVALWIMFITGWTIWYVMSQNKVFPPISELADVKTIQSVKPAWVIVTRYICVWDCRDYNDDDSRWWSSYGWGK